MPKQNTHGGPNRGQGRHKEPGYERIAKIRYLTEAEEAELIKAKLTPRQRAEILLAWVREQNEQAESNQAEIQGEQNEQASP